ncbi:MAG: DUF47 family protein [Spirochaetes bacterium]|nr:DUF47 family protein [Spirochaetota bacterium]
MSLTTFFKFLSPKDSTFFPLFKKDTDNLIVMGDVLLKLITTKKRDEREKLTNDIDRLENIGDDITHQIYVELEKTFITPFDREDVHALAAALDDIADYIQGTAARVRLYHISTVPKPVADMTLILQEGIQEISKSVALLMDLRKHKEINESLVKIHSLENAADRIFNTAIELLFLKEKNAIQLIKLKELLAQVETATDRCEDVANVIESIVIKYS